MTRKETDNASWTANIYIYLLGNGQIHWSSENQTTIVTEEA